jgi:D-aminopeptidase
MNGVQDAVLHHTQSHIGELKYWYNDVECGEIAQSSLVLGHFDAPVVMATGCNRACEEARRFLGEEIVTVEVKEGLSRTSCRMIAPPAARELIHAGAAEAMGRVAQCRPLKYDLPIRGRLRIENKETVDQYAANGNSRRVDDLTLEREFASALEIYYF